MAQKKSGQVIKVKSLRCHYPVVVGNRMIEKTGSYLTRLGLKGRVMIVTQEPCARHYLNPVKKSLARHGFDVYVKVLPDGETAKAEAPLFDLYHDLLSYGFERRDTLLALGGGVAGDLTGFAAATYLRGISFVNVPTTLLAQVDSAIGGKTGINLGEGKNLVGAFYPASIVLSDISVLKTLTNRHFYASLAEVIKYGVICDRSLFELLDRESEAIMRRQESALLRIVRRSAAIKAGVVSRDEFETRGERMFLNFGHTFGHAFEQALDYRKLLHGEAVSIGMVCAARLAVKIKIFYSSS